MIMVKLFFIVILLPLLTTCNYRWVAYPQYVKEFEKCQKFSSRPQLLKVPGLKKSYIMVYNCGVMDRQRVSIGVTIFLEEWNRVYRSDTQYKAVEKTMNNILIEFSDVTKELNAYDVSGNYIKNANIIGLAQGPTMAWVKATPGDLLCQTSFAHELMHLTIWTLVGGRGDPDHLGTKYLGWTNDSMAIIQTTNQRLCALGI
jgi:hypothetical protein